MGVVTVLCATDLDRTLIYSRRALGDDPPPLRAVEQRDQACASWMTTAAADRYARLAERVVVVPVTTRTPDQWYRVRLPGPPPEYVVTANGGMLLVAGRPDRSWDATVAAQLSRVAPLDEIWRHVSQACRPEWTVKLRNAHGLFCYALLHRGRVPAGFAAETAGWVEQRGWVQSVQGRRIYWVPRTLSKAAAVVEVARRVGCHEMVAAGDSLLDADLLATADRGLAVRHGELVASGWTMPHVVVTEHSWVRAGAEVVDWLTAQLDE